MAHNPPQNNPFDFDVSLNNSRFTAGLGAPNYIDGHKYLLILNIDLYNCHYTDGLEQGDAIYFHNSSWRNGAFLVGVTEAKVYMKFAYPNVTESTDAYMIDTSVARSGTFHIKGSVFMYNLTKMYGAGNEPENIEDVKWLLASLRAPFNILDR